MGTFWFCEEISWNRWVNRTPNTWSAEQDVYPIKWSFPDLKPRMKENYRGRAVSLWLSLVPKLEQAGGYDGGGGLTGLTWGLVRNTTNIPGVQQISLNDKVSRLQTAEYWLLRRSSWSGGGGLPGVRGDDQQWGGQGELPPQPHQPDPGEPGGGLRPLHRQHGHPGQSVLQEVRGAQAGSPLGQSRGQTGDLQHGVPQLLPAHDPPPAADLQHPGPHLLPPLPVSRALRLPPGRPRLRGGEVPELLQCWQLCRPLPLSPPSGRRLSVLLGPPRSGHPRPGGLQQPRHPREGGVHHLLSNTRYYRL